MVVKIGRLGTMVLSRLGPSTPGKRYFQVLEARQAAVLVAHWELLGSVMLTLFSLYLVTTLEPLDQVLNRILNTEGRTRLQSFLWLFVLFTLVSALAVVEKVFLLRAALQENRRALASWLISQGIFLVVFAVFILILLVCTVVLWPLGSLFVVGLLAVSCSFEAYCWFAVLEACRSPLTPVSNRKDGVSVLGDDSMFVAAA